MKLKFISFILLLSGFFLADLNACSGDCVTCHPKLLQKNNKLDEDHRILNLCKNCHIDGTKIEMVEHNSTYPLDYRIVKVDDLNKSTHSACGSDCWQCHDIEKVGKIDIPEHKALPKCIKCHIKIKKEVLKLGTTPTTGNTLMDNLFNGQ